MQLRSVTRAVVALDKDFHLADHAHAGRTSAALPCRFVLLSITVLKQILLIKIPKIHLIDQKWK